MRAYRKERRSRSTSALSRAPLPMPPARLTSLLKTATGVLPFTCHHFPSRPSSLHSPLASRSTESGSTVADSSTAPVGAKATASSSSCPGSRSNGCDSCRVSRALRTATMMRGASDSGRPTRRASGSTSRTRFMATSPWSSPVTRTSPSAYPLTPSSVYLSIGIAKSSKDP